MCRAQNLFQELSGNRDKRPGIGGKQHHLIAGGLGPFQVSGVFLDDTPDPADCDGTPVPDPPNVVRGVINMFNVLPGTYDVRLENPDGQSVTLVGGLVVQ